MPIPLLDEHPIVVDSQVQLVVEIEGWRVKLKGKGGRRDLSEVPGCDERAEGPYLPQAAQVEVSEMREN
jgi:hypothetical protein